MVYPREHVQQHIEDHYRLYTVHTIMILRGDCIL